MNAIDTNVLIYYLDQNEAVKQAKAIALLNQLLSPT
jgi:predicted nucleic acid-binding protein